MSEKRKPKITMLLKWEANGNKITNKVELFEAALWETEYQYSYRKLYRLRVNGKWHPKGTRKYFYKTEIRDLLWRSIPFN